MPPTCYIFWTVHSKWIPKMTDLGFQKPSKILPKSNKKTTKRRHKKGSTTNAEIRRKYHLQISKNIQKPMQHRQKHKITYTHFETICARKTPPKKFDPFPIRSRLKTTITTGKISSSKSIEHDDHDEDDDHDKKNHDDEKNLMTRKNSCKGMKDLRRLVRNQRLGDQNECHAAWES